MAVPTIVLEAWMGGAWVDLSGYLKAARGHGVRIKRGRESQDESRPGSCEFTLVNNDGRFSDGNSIYPEFRRWVPIRESVNGEVRFIGYVADLPSGPDGLIDRALAQIVATDVLGVGSLSPTRPTSADAVIAGLNPVAWFPLDEPVKSQMARDRVGTGALVATQDSGVAAATFGADAADGLRVSRQVSLGKLEGAVPQPASTTSWTLLAVLTVPTGGSATVYLGGGVRGGLSVGTPILMSLDGDGVASAMDMRGGATAVPAAGVTTPGRPVLLALSVSGTTARLVGTTSQATLASNLDLAALLNPASAGEAQIMASGVNASCCHIAVLDYAMTEGQYRATLGALLEDNDLSAPVSAILQPSIDAAGIDATVQVLGYDRFMLAPDLSGETLTSAGGKLAQAAGAMFVADRATGDPTWIDHRYVGPALTIPITDLDLSSLTHNADRSLAVTDVEVGGEIIASAPDTVWPRESRTLEPLLPADMIKGYADWLVNTGEVMARSRMFGLRVNLNRDTVNPADYLALDLKHRITIDGLPAWAPGGRVNTIEGYEEFHAIDNWWIEFNTAPDPRGAYADAAQGIAGATADNRYGY